MSMEKEQIIKLIDERIKFYEKNFTKEDCIYTVVLEFKHLKHQLNSLA
jgi:hypothetical protein